MRGRSSLLSAVAVTSCGPSQGAGPAMLSNAVYREEEIRLADGRSDIRLAPATQIAPGERVLFVLTLRNVGARSAAGLVVTNPLPSGVIYAGPRDGAPEASVDGRTFGPLGDLRVAREDGEEPAGMSDVTALRWLIPGCVPPDGEVRLSYRGRLRA